MDRIAARALTDLKNIRHGFFGREGGVSEGVYKGLNCGAGSKDDPRAVRENREIAAATLALPGTALLSLFQHHSTEVVTVEGAWSANEHPRADAMVTAISGLGLGILTADCAPVLLADAAAGVIGAAHAGWKGALGGVLEATIVAMEALGAKRENMSAAVGPAIAQASYEVGPEFHAAFLDSNSAHAGFFQPALRPDHYQFDLSGFCLMRLRQAGIPRVEDLALDTYAAEARFYSYRRNCHQGIQDYGRLLSAITLTPHS